MSNIMYRIDANIKDDNVDALRRSLYQSREEQARASGYRGGYEEGYSAGMERGWNNAMDSVFKLLHDYRTGQR